MSILKELEKNLPKDASISEIKFEGSEIILYTKNTEFFRDHDQVIKQIVSGLKKRVEIRPDLSITLDQEKTMEKIKSIVPEEAGVQAIYFEPELGKVIIECTKPGLVIGKGGETYRRIKSETLWLPKIERAPVIKSDIVRAVRNLLHTEIDYRKKFLNKIGQKINTALPEGLEDWVRLSFLGGQRQVGRSCMMVQTPSSSVLMDCGVNVANSTVPYTNAPEFNVEKLDAICISHAHLDHCGYIPHIYAMGYDGPTYCTAPTRDLMVLLCMDYIEICQKEGRELPYTRKDVERAVKHTITLDYGEVSDITPDIRLTFQPAGHLLGSSLIHLHIGDGLHNILYTGDFKFGRSMLFSPAWTDFKRVETLIMESTYGGQNDMMPPRNECEEKMLSVINATMEKGGKVLIPSFAVGRAQEVMAILSSANFKYPIWMEGMLWDATAIHTAYPEYLSPFLQKEIFHRGNNPFTSPMFKRVAPKERKDIIDSAEPGVIIATSGMLIGGPAVEYLKGLAHDPKNMLLFVGYQAEGTMGSRIQKGWKEVPVSTEEGKTRTVRMEMGVDTIGGLSGHADRKELTSFVYKLSSRPDRVITVHGDSHNCVDLARDLHRMFKVETESPRPLEVMRLR